MARSRFPFGKALMAGANLLSNPAGAIASVFSKKKAKARRLKPGRTVASAGLVRRYYKGRRTGGHVTNDGQGNEKMSIVHGRQHAKLSRSLEAKIRDALNPMNVYIAQTTLNQNSILLGQNQWSSWMLGDCNDIDQLVSKLSGNAGLADGTAGKLHIANAHMELFLTNQSTNVLNLRLYEVIARKDLPVDLTSVLSVVQNGFTKGAVNQADYHTLGATLFQNPEFCSYFKIIKVRNIQIGSGRVMKLTLENNYDKIINPMIYNTVDNLTEARYTRGFILQAYGGMVGAPAGVDDGKGTTGFVNFDALQIRRYHFNQPWSGSKVTYLDDTVPKTIPGGLGQLMNPSTQQAEYQQNA